MRALAWAVVRFLCLHFDCVPLGRDQYGMAWEECTVCGKTRRTA